MSKVSYYSSDGNQGSACMSVNSSVMRLTQRTEAVGYNLDSARLFMQILLPIQVQLLEM